MGSSIECPCCGEQLTEDDGTYCVACSPEIHTCTRRDALIDDEEYERR